MGLLIRAHGVQFEDSRAPIVAEIDPIEAAGSLYLVDATHPKADPWSATYLQHEFSDYVVPNIFAERAADLTGGAIDDVRNAPVLQNGMDGVKGGTELSAKGGIHAVYNNADPTNTSTSSSCYLEFDYPADVLRYIGENYDHELYQSAWVVKTRGPVNVSHPNAHICIADRISSTTNYKQALHHAGQLGADSYRYSPVFAVAGSGPRFMNIARAGHSGTAPDSVATGYDDQCTYAYQVGNHRTINSYQTAKQNVTSVVIYRLYLEDLTVSGRSYAEVDALDLELFEREVLTEGGRYYGDTYTDPDTIT